MLSQASSALDKAAKKGALHRNTAARGNPADEATKPAKASPRTALASGAAGNRPAQADSAPLSRSAVRLLFPPPSATAHQIDSRRLARCAGTVGCWIILDLGPQQRYARSRSACPHIVCLPHLLDDLRPAEHLAGIAQEKDQERCLLRTQMIGLVAFGERSRIGSSAKAQLGSHDLVRSPPAFSACAAVSSR